MQFNKLNKTLLKKLNKSGFTILSSTNKEFSETVHWFPEKVYDLGAYLTELDLCGEQSVVPLILSIEDAISKIEENSLQGLVFN